MKKKYYKRRVKRYKRGKGVLGYALGHVFKTAFQKNPLVFFGRYVTLNFF